MTAQEDLNAAIAAIRAKIEEALARLADNPTAEGVAASTAALTELGALVDSIDPAIPGGPINPDTVIS